MAWDPEQYARFSEERARPFHDLLARVPPIEPRRIADLGCGAGEKTRLLADRWPEAEVLGVDESEAMLARAAELARAHGGRLRFARADLRDWRPEAPLDLLVANASLHWVPDHERLVPALAGFLAPRGVIAVQVPGNTGAPSHQAIREQLAEPRWSQRLKGRPRPPSPVLPLAWYEERLRALGFAVDAWETTYHHALRGDAPVLEWVRGTTLLPVLSELDEDERREFLAALRGRLEPLYAAREGVTIFPFRRIFFVAQAPAR